MVSTAIRPGSSDAPMGWRRRCLHDCDPHV